jgi:hypothetical protein
MLRLDQFLYTLAGFGGDAVSDMHTAAVQVNMLLTCRASHRLYTALFGAK